MGIAVRPGHGVAVISTVLSVIVAVGRIPCLVVVGAVQSLGDAVLGKDIGVEEGLVCC